MMETILTSVFFGLLGIVGISISIYLSSHISGFIIDSIDHLIHGVPEGLVISKKSKNKGKTEPIPIDHVIAGSMF